MTHWLTHFVDESHKRLVYVTLPTVYSQDDANPSLTPYTELLESATNSSSIQSSGVKDFKSRTTVTSRNISRTLFLSFEKNISRFMALLNKSHKKTGSDVTRAAGAGAHWDCPNERYITLPATLCFQPQAEVLGWQGRPLGWPDKVWHEVSMTRFHKQYIPMSMQ